MSAFDDPWTYFGSYAEVEVMEAKQLLATAKIKFEIKKSKSEDHGGWTGPFALWIDDDDAARASSILVPHFQSRKT